MRPVTDEFLAAVGGSRELAVEAVLYPPEDADRVELDVISGSVTLDAAASVRGRLDLTLQGVDWVPRSASDRLAPAGSEINVRVGVRFPDGSTELTSVGWFGVEDVQVDDDGSQLQCSVTGLDRAARLSYAKFEDAFEVTSGTAFADAILDLAQDAWPDVPYMDGFTDASSVSIGRNIVAAAGDDRWEFMQGLATALGMSLYFDGDGDLTLRRYAEQGVVFTVSEATDSEPGVLIRAQKGWSRTNAFNKVIATGENTDSTDVYRGEAVDDNPLSPTFYDGPFGRAPRFYQSPDIYSDEQAEDAARTILAKELGIASTVSFDMVPNPALEPEDTVLVVRDRLGVNEQHVLDSVTIGLSADDAMSCQTRERLVV